MKKTVFVLLDACQYEAGTRNLGYLEHMVEVKRAAKYKVRGELPSLSRPIYATLLTGVPVFEHGITTNDIKDTLALDSVFSICRKQGGTTAAAAYHWMSELYNTTPFRIPEDRIQIKTGKSIENGIYYWEDMYPDSHVFADGEYLRRTYAPDFLLIHTMCIDYMGHKYGADSQQYETAVAMVGHELASYVPIWRKEGYNIVITADHGMNQFGIHGGTGTAQRDTPLYIFSEKIETGDFSGNYIDQLCIAPLLCSLMGLDPSEEMVKDIPIRFHG